MSSEGRLYEPAINDGAKIAVSDHGIVVLDAAGARMQVPDFDGNRIGYYRVVVGVDRENGLALDRDGNIYIRYVARSIISVYKPDGTPMGTFGQSGSRIGEFLAPRGLGVDASNRIYVADTVNARVKSSKSVRGQPFHISSRHGLDQGGRESMRAKKDVPPALHGSPQCSASIHRQKHRNRDHSGCFLCDYRHRRSVTLETNSIDNGRQS
jgi:hypothetical protein